MDWKEPIVGQATLLPVIGGYGVTDKLAIDYFYNPASHVDKVFGAHVVRNSLELDYRSPTFHLPIPCGFPEKEIQTSRFIGAIMSNQVYRMMAEDHKDHKFKEAEGKVLFIVFHDKNRNVVTLPLGFRPSGLPKMASALHNFMRWFVPERNLHFKPIMERDVQWRITGGIQPIEMLRRAKNETLRRDPSKRRTKKEVLLIDAISAETTRSMEKPRRPKHYFLEEVQGIDHLNVRPSGSAVALPPDNRPSQQPLEGASAMAIPKQRWIGGADRIGEPKPK